MFSPAGQWLNPDDDAGVDVGFSNENAKANAKKNIIGNRQSLFKGDYKKFGLL